MWLMLSIFEESFLSLFSMLSFVSNEGFITIAKSTILLHNVICLVEHFGKRSASAIQTAVTIVKSIFFDIQ